MVWLMVSKCFMSFSYEWLGGDDGYCGLLSVRLSIYIIQLQSSYISQKYKNLICNVFSADICLTYQLLHDNRILYFKKIKKMLKYYTNKQYRRIYTQLTKLSLLTNDNHTPHDLYQQYLREQVLMDPHILPHLQILAQGKMQPMRIIKTLAFLHVWLQTTCLLEDRQPALRLLNFLLQQAKEMLDKQARTMIKQGKNGKHAVINQNPNSFRKKFSKEGFLLQEIAVPYVHYLQKIIAQFQFYNTLKKNIGRTITQTQSWAVLNLFSCVTLISGKLAIIWQLFRKSFLPFAQAIAQTLHQDIHHFYPKLEKYCLRQNGVVSRNKIVTKMSEMEKQALRCIEREVDVLNCNLEDIYDFPLFQRMNLYEPNYIQSTKLLQDFGQEDRNQFQLEGGRGHFQAQVQEQQQEQVEMAYPTGCFHQTLPRKDQAQSILKKLPPMFSDISPPVFCDIANQQQYWTLRSGNCSQHKFSASSAYPNSLRERQKDCVSVIENE